MNRLRHRGRQLATLQERQGLAKHFLRRSKLLQ
jgi:hypothetical protein